MKSWNVIALLAFSSMAGGCAALAAPPKPTGVPQLRYGWKAGETYVYAVRIETDGDEHVVKLEVTSIYRVRKVEKNIVTLVHQAQLPRNVQPKAGAGPVRIGPPPFFFPFAGLPRPGAVQEHEIKLNDRGEIVRTKGQSQIGFALGNLSYVVFEPLPAEKKNTWEVTQVYLIQEYRGFSRPFAGDDRQTTTTPAEQKSIYTLGTVAGDVVSIKKKFELATFDKVGDLPRFQMTGDGVINFDLKAGVPRSMESKAVLSATSGNITQRTPITITYKLLEGTEREVALQPPPPPPPPPSPPKPLDDAGLTKALKDLKSGSRIEKRQALDGISRTPANQRRQEVAKALDEFLSQADSFSLPAALKALGTWGGKEDVPVLIEMAADSDGFVSGAAVEALGKLKDERAVEPIAKLLPKHQHRRAVSEALKSFGPAAEKAVVPHLKSTDYFTAAEACNILKEIGTKASLPALEEASKEGSPLMSQAAKEAIRSIKLRERKKP